MQSFNQNCKMAFRDDLIKFINKDVNSKYFAKWKIKDEYLFENISPLRLALFNPQDSLLPVDISREFDGILVDKVGQKLYKDSSVREPLPGPRLQMPQQTQAAQEPVSASLVCISKFDIQITDNSHGIRQKRTCLEIERPSKQLLFLNSPDLENTQISFLFKIPIKFYNTDFAKIYVQTSNKTTKDMSVKKIVDLDSFQQDFLNLHNMGSTNCLFESSTFITLFRSYEKLSSTKVYLQYLTPPPDTLRKLFMTVSIEVDYEHVLNCLKVIDVQILVLSKHLLLRCEHFSEHCSYGSIVEVVKEFIEEKLVMRLKVDQKECRHEVISNESDFYRLLESKKPMLLDRGSGLHFLNKFHSSSVHLMPLVNTRRTVSCVAKACFKVPSKKLPVIMIYFDQIENRKSSQKVLGKNPRHVSLAYDVLIIQSQKGIKEFEGIGASMVDNPMFFAHTGDNSMSRYVINKKGECLYIRHKDIFSLHNLELYDMFTQVDLIEIQRRKKDFLLYWKEISSKGEQKYHKNVPLRSEAELRLMNSPISSESSPGKSPKGRSPTKSPGYPPVSPGRQTNAKSPRNSQPDGGPPVAPLISPAAPESTVCSSTKSIIRSHALPSASPVSPGPFMPGPSLTKSPASLLQTGASPISPGSMPSPSSTSSLLDSPALKPSPGSPSKSLLPTRPLLIQSNISTISPLKPKSLESSETAVAKAANSLLTSGAISISGFENPSMDLGYIIDNILGTTKEVSKDLGFLNIKSSLDKISGPVSSTTNICNPLAINIQEEPTQMMKKKLPPKSRVLKKPSLFSPESSEDEADNEPAVEKEEEKMPASSGTLKITLRKNQLSFDKSSSSSDSDSPTEDNVHSTMEANVNDEPLSSVSEKDPELNAYKSEADLGVNKLKKCSIILERIEVPGSMRGQSRKHAPKNEMQDHNRSAALEKVEKKDRKAQEEEREIRVRREKRERKEGVKQDERLDPIDVVDLFLDNFDRLQDVPGIDDEVANKIIDYRQKCKDFNNFKSRWFFFKLLTKDVQHDVGGLRRGDLALAYKGVRLDEDTLVVVSWKLPFKNADKIVSDAPLPVKIVLLGCLGHSEMAQYFKDKLKEKEKRDKDPKKNKLQTDLSWVTLVNNLIKQSGLSLDEFFKKAKGKNTEKSHHRSRHKDSGKSDTENKSDKENQQKPLEKKLKLSARENVPKLRVQSVSKPALLPNEKKTTLNRKIPGSPQRSAPKVKLGEIVLTAASRSDSSDLDSEEDGGPAPRNKGARATDSTAAVDSRGETINDSRGETIEAQDESSDSDIVPAPIKSKRKLEKLDTDTDESTEPKKKCKVVEPVGKSSRSLILKLPNPAAKRRKSEEHRKSKKRRKSAERRRTEPSADEPPANPSADEPPANSSADEKVKSWLSNEPVESETAASPTKAAVDFREVPKVASPPPLLPSPPRQHRTPHKPRLNQLNKQTVVRVARQRGINWSFVGSQPCWSKLVIDNDVVDIQDLEPIFPSYDEAVRVRDRRRELQRSDTIQRSNTFCSLCSLELETIAMMLVHAETVHTEAVLGLHTNKHKKPAFSCGRCGKKYTRQERLNEHILHRHI